MDLRGALARDGEVASWGGADLLEEGLDDDDAAASYEAGERTAGT